MAEEREGKIGDGMVGGMGRLGLRELRSAVYPGSNVAQNPEYGIYGQWTPAEISAARDTDMNEEKDGQNSTLARKMQEARDMAPNEDMDKDRNFERER